MACSVTAAAPTVTAAPLDPSPSQTAVIIVVTATQQETATLEPTATSEPTLTPLPTETGVPQPRKPKAKSSNADGDCGTGGLGPEGNYDCKVVMSDGLPLQFKVLKDGHEIGKGDGVQDVNFEVSRNGNVVYSNDEKNEAYCLFGGNGPCNSWTVEDNVYKWESGGLPVKAGKYNLHIEAFTNEQADSLDMNWNATVTITFP
jgi:hypothetical protein